MACQLQPGHLLTREERLILRWTQQDLERQAERASDSTDRDRLTQLAANVEMERRNDKACRPRRRNQDGKKKGRKR